MTNKLKVMLAGILCLSFLQVPLSVSAKVDLTEYDYEKEWCYPNGEVYNTETRHRIEIQGDAFHYSVDRMYDGNEITWRSSGYLESDVVDANFIVTGVYYKEGEPEPCWYTLNLLDKATKCIDMQCRAEDILPYIEGDSPQTGDLLHIENASWTEIYLPTMRIDDGGFVVNYGSGIDLFGEDFKKVLYYELYDEPVVGEPYADHPASQSGYNYEIYDKGNLNNDDEINLLDVVALNKNIMIGEPIGYYAQGCADVDNDGKLTPTDSLGILKYCVGLIDSFEELQ